MARDAKRHQKALARRAARRKGRKKGGQSPGSLGRRAAHWPLLECLIAANWRNTMEISNLVVARQSAAGDVAMAHFLVDLACLGLKNGMVQVFPSEADYRGDYLPTLLETQALEACELDLAAKILHEAVAYARRLGFQPHPDGRKALALLGDANPQSRSETIPLGGEDGKPFFLAGPHDNTKRIVQTLERNVGPGNYNFTAPPDGVPFFYDKDEDDFAEEK